jgi:hypothetical protein
VIYPVIYGRAIFSNKDTSMITEVMSTEPTALLDFNDADIN